MVTEENQAKTIVDTKDIKIQNVILTYEEALDTYDEGNFNLLNSIIDKQKSIKEGELIKIKGINNSDVGRSTTATTYIISTMPESIRVINEREALKKKLRTDLKRIRYAADDQINDLKSKYKDVKNEFFLFNKYPIPLTKDLINQCRNKLNEAHKKVDDIIKKTRTIVNKTNFEAQKEVNDFELRMNRIIEDEIIKMQERLPELTNNKEKQDFIFKVEKRNKNRKTECLRKVASIYRQRDMKIKDLMQQRENKSQVIYANARKENVNMVTTQRITEINSEANLNSKNKIMAFHLEVENLLKSFKYINKDDNEGFANIHLKLNSFITKVKQSQFFTLHEDKEAVTTLIDKIENGINSKFNVKVNEMHEMVRNKFKIMEGKNKDKVTPADYILFTEKRIELINKEYYQLLEIIFNECSENNSVKVNGNDCERVEEGPTKESDISDIDIKLKSIENNEIIKLDQEVFDRTNLTFLLEPIKIANKVNYTKDKNNDSEETMGKFFNKLNEAQINGIKVSEDKTNNTLTNENSIVKVTGNDVDQLNRDIINNPNEPYHCIDDKINQNNEILEIEENNNSGSKSPKVGTETVSGSEKVRSHTEYHNVEIDKQENYQRSINYVFEPIIKYSLKIQYVYCSYYQALNVNINCPNYTTLIMDKDEIQDKVFICNFHKVSESSDSEVDDQLYRPFVYY